MTRFILIAETARLQHWPRGGSGRAEQDAARATVPAAAEHGHHGGLGRRAGGHDFVCNRFPARLHGARGHVRCSEVPPSAPSLVCVYAASPTWTPICLDQNQTLGGRNRQPSVLGPDRLLHFHFFFQGRFSLSFKFRMLKIKKKVTWENRPGLPIGLSTFYFFIFPFECLF